MTLCFSFNPIENQNRPQNYANFMNCANKKVFLLYKTAIVHFTANDTQSEEKSRYFEYLQEK